MRILVIEDEPDLCQALVRMLTKAGYAVDCAADGRSGLQKALDWNYDSIVLDWLLPQLDGGEVLRELRKLKRTPVLILSARDRSPDIVNGLDRGADDYLIKPFVQNELLARLRALIRRTTGQSENTHLLGNLRIDLGKRVVEQDGRPVILTGREFAILECLLLQRGKVVTRTELYDHLFNEAEDTLSNLLDVHVSNLRKKLGAEVIQTHRGIGYRIDD